MDPEYLAYPFSIDGRGRTATTDSDDHVRDLIEQVLFTNPGERVNRPDFGCGLKHLVFAPNSQALAAATQVLVKSALQKWLERVILVQQVDITAADDQLSVQVSYINLRNGQQSNDQFSAPA